MPNIANPTAEDKLLLAKVCDAVDTARENYYAKYIGFLDERRAELALMQLRSLNCTSYMLYGGYEGAGRVYLGVFPEYEHPAEGGFPITPVTFTYRKIDILSHRDFLGSLMALMITRDSIGDILVGEGVAVAFLSEKAAQLAATEITKVGRIGVKAQIGTPDILPVSESFEKLEGVVASPRLDCIAAFITAQSREKAVKLIEAGLVSVNFSVCEDCSGTVNSGDKISVRGYGRYIFDGADGTTKKGRCHVSARKYI